MLPDCSLPIKLGQAINFEGFFKMFHEYHDFMVRLMLYGYISTLKMSVSTNYFGDISYTNHT